ncbi:MAG: outer membrane beta-barrel protein, partial [Thermoguttaceae bacterium]
AATEPAAPAAPAPNPHEGDGFFLRLWENTWEAVRKDGFDDPGPDPPRRCNPPAVYTDPPFTSLSEFQGYPLIGIPGGAPIGILPTTLQEGPNGQWWKDTRCTLDGWIEGGANLSSAKLTNTPAAYWIVPNSVQLDQAVLRFQRTCDTVQTDHWDFGFKSILLYGMDYRYMVAGGWWPGYQELLFRNELYGLDFTEQFLEFYCPYVAQGMSIRVGRWIACPDIETQYGPDNYTCSHSLLFTYDTYTQTGVMMSFKINRQLMVQGAIESGTDMAPWYPGAVATGMVGLRWVSEDNHDSFYSCVNEINASEFRNLTQYSYLTGTQVATGHDDYNYYVSSYQHKFNDNVHTAFEAYYMWQMNTVLGGTPSIGPTAPYGGGGGLTPGPANFVNGANIGGSYLPGLSRTYGFLNYTEFAVNKTDYITVRNEWWDDTRGMRSGIPGNYTSNTIGYCKNFNAAVQMRPEIGYYRNWNNPAFDSTNPNGNLKSGFGEKGMLMGGIDATFHF